MALCDEIRELTSRALWETENLIKCIPDALWDARYDEIPMWKYVYHMLYSMDRWYVNPCDPKYRDPVFHVVGLNDLNVVPGAAETVTRAQMEDYFYGIKDKLLKYAGGLEDGMLGEKPEGCDFSRFKLILGQFRHWHRHMGVIYGFIIVDDRKWPYVLNMCGEYPEEPMPNYFD